jgi:hypothetical protein
MSKRVQEFLKRWNKSIAFSRAQKAIEDLRKSCQYKGKDMPRQRWVDLKTELARQLMLSLSQEQRASLIKKLENEDNTFDDLLDGKER